MKRTRINMHPVAVSLPKSHVPEEQLAEAVMTRPGSGREIISEFAQIVATRPARSYQ